MKQLSEHITEALKINSKSKVNNNILDSNINSIEELRDVIEEYFKRKWNVTVTDIKQNEVKWRMTNAMRITVNNHFSVSFFKNNKLSKKLQFAENNNHFLMQVIVKDYKNKWQHCRIHGKSFYAEFKVGDNLLEFIKVILKHAKDNRSFGDPNIVDLFKEIYEELN